MSLCSIMGVSRVRIGLPQPNALGLGARNGRRRGMQQCPRYFDLDLGLRIDGHASASASLKVSEVSTDGRP